MQDSTHGLAVIETHPVQYHAPVYRCLQQDFGIPVTAIYGSDFSVIGYQDREFGTRFAWDTDLLSGYASRFLQRCAKGGAQTAEATTAHGLGKILREVSPAAVLLTGYSPRFYRQALGRSWRFGRPLLFRAETTDHARQRSFLKHWLRDRMLRWFYRRCAALLFVGQHSRRHFLRLRCPAGKLFFSPYCVDEAPFATDEAARDQLRPVVHAELGIADDRLVWLFCGKLVRRKGPDLLLQALRRLPEPLRRRSVVLFLGDGELRDSLEQMAAGAMPVETRFLGFQNQTRLSRYYHAADMLVLPSVQSETWGLVVNEALGHGLACVVSDQVGCVPDLIVPGQTGEVFASADAAALTEAMRRALNWVGRAEVRQACRAQVGGYSVKAAAQGIAQAFQAVLKTQSARDS